MGRGFRDTPGLKKQGVHQTVCREFESPRRHRLFPFPVKVPFNILATETPLVAAFISLEHTFAGEVVDRVGAHVQKIGQVARLEDVGEAVQSSRPFRT